MFLDSHRPVITFCSWLDLLGFVVACLDFYSNNFQYHCGQSITACSMRLLFTFSPGHVLRSVCLQFIAYEDNT